MPTIRKRTKYPAPPVAGFHNGDQLMRGAPEPAKLPKTCQRGSSLAKAAADVAWWYDPEYSDAAAALVALRKLRRLTSREFAEKMARL